MRRLRSFVAGVLLSLTLGGTPVLAPDAFAQISAATDTLHLSLAAGEQSEVPLALTNGGAVALTLALAPETAESLDERPGELLFKSSVEDIVRPYAMTGGNRIFVVWDHGDGVTEVKELSPELEVIRTFEYISGAFGVVSLTWMPPEDTPGYPEGTLWWLTSIGIYDPPECVIGVEEVRLVETDLDAVPTGRMVEIPVRSGNSDIGFCTAIPYGLGYDEESGLFFHLEAPFNELWAIGLGGEVHEGYPVPATDYDLRGRPLEDLDASGGTLDMLVGVKASNDWDRLYRVVVTDHDGTNTGVETPLMHFAPTNPPQYFNTYGVLRSRPDLSVIYFSVAEGSLGDEPWNAQWIYAVRAAPLPPRWLRVAPVSPELLALGAGGTAEATVKLNASGLEPGTYEGAVAFREDDSGGDVLLRVPVVLTVTPGVGAEDGAEPGEASGLVVYPNPFAGEATVVLSLAEASEVRVAVYDVLGREVAVLHAGPMGAGEHTLRFEGAGLPAGLYLVRASSVGQGARGLSLVQQFTVLR